MPPLPAWARYALAVLAGVVIGAGAAIGLATTVEEDSVPRAASATGATVRIEGDDTALQRLIAASFAGGGVESDVEIVAEGLPAGFPDFPAVPNATLLGGQVARSAQFGEFGSAVYEADAEPEAAMDSLRAEAEAAGWSAPENAGRFSAFPGPAAYSVFCPEDGGRDAAMMNVTAAARAGGGSLVTVSYSRGQSDACNDPGFGAAGPVDRFPQLLNVLQSIRPEGSQPDFRISGSGSSSSDRSYSTSFGYAYDGGDALVVASFYRSELAALDVQRISELETRQPVGDEEGALLRLGFIEGEGEEARRFDGWLLVRRLVDAEGPPLMLVDVYVNALPEGVETATP